MEALVFSFLFTLFQEDPLELSVGYPPDGRVVGPLSGCLAIVSVLMPLRRRADAGHPGAIGWPS